MYAFEEHVFNDMQLGQSLFFWRDTMPESSGSIPGFST
jgi:hypothetical protein